MFFLLAGWAAVSWLAGLVLLLALPQHALAQAAAAQCVMWGLLNTAFALFGLRQAQQADRTPVTSTIIVREFIERDRLLRLLRFSVWVCAGFIAASSLLLAVGAWFRSPAAIGHAGAMLIQTLVLLLFDRAFLFRLGMADTRADLAANNPSGAIDAPGSGR
jgi:hypothetical protein